MSNETKKAKVKKTGIEVEVYRHNDGSWVNYSDCTTKYKASELIFQ